MGYDLHFRKAVISDLPVIMRLLSEIRLLPDAAETTAHSISYSETALQRAFREIEADRNNELVVGISGDEIVGLFQITYIPGLTLGGTKRAVVEGVRVSANRRGTGIGRKLMIHALERAKENGCGLLQLTTNDWREDAIAFYGRLGFKRTHVGLRTVL